MARAGIALAIVSAMMRKPAAARDAVDIHVHEVPLRRGFVVIVGEETDLVANTRCTDPGHAHSRMHEIGCRLAPDPS